MADPRFYDNRGPFSLADVCAVAAVPLPEGADRKALIHDVAGLASATSGQLAFFIGGFGGAEKLEKSRAGYCFVPRGKPWNPPPGMTVLPADSPQHAFAAACELFYPDWNKQEWAQNSVHPSAKLAADVSLAPGVVIGADVEIGAGSRIGANTVIGRGVAIGARCVVGSNVSISHAYIGDEVVILPGSQIGQSGFGFASSPAGHTKLPHLGRVILQDRVEIGSVSAVDRGALGDTVLGEGTKIDNLVQIGHNVRIGRHCIMAGQAGISGSSELGDFVILGGQSAVADHARLGDGARAAGQTGFPRGDFPGGKDYGGTPARTAMEWKREQALLAKLIKPKRTKE